MQAYALIIYACNGFSEDYNETMAGVEVLETELATFEAHRDELLGRHRGGYALIKGEVIYKTTFDTQGDAIRIGYSEYGNVPFLTKQITEVDQPMRFTRDLGL